MHHGTRTAAIVNVQLCIASFLNRRYLQVSVSVRVRRGIVGQLGLGLVLVRVRTIPIKVPNTQYPIILAYPNANTNTGA